MKAILSRITFWRVVAVLILGAGLVASVQRFVFGLGYATNLSDAAPWGLWVGFDVISGVGLAAGGFTITAAVYIFNLKDYHCIVRPTVLTAFLGYVLVGVSLLWDLGKYFDIWHPLVYGNVHSPMFELAVCVATYTGVLALEFSSYAFRKVKWLQKPVAILRKSYLVLVIAGVLISTLHQSSLGTLFVIVPQKLHPLWYSQLLPLYFFITAVGAGLGMTIVESYLSYRGLGHEAPHHILGNLARAMVVIQAIYTVMLIEGLIVQGTLHRAFDGSLEANPFLFENFIWLVVPAVVVFNKHWLSTRLGVSIAGFSYVLGFLLNRLNVSITALEYSSGAGYVPSWQEVVVSASFVVVAFMVFRFAVLKFDIFTEGEHEHEALSAPAEAADVGPGSETAPA